MVHLSARRIGVLDLLRRLRLWPERGNSVEPRPDVCNWSRIGSVDALTKSGRLRTVLPPDNLPVMAMTTKHGPVVFVDRCPHLGRTLWDAELRGTQVVCKGHGQRFKITSAATVGPCVGGPLTQLMRLPCSVSGDDLLVGLPHDAAGLAASGQARYQAEA